jgi:PKD repeat protein
MKKYLLLVAFAMTFLSAAKAQVVCIYCYDQNDSISANVNNLIQNGSFESSTCGGLGYFCPASVNYSCDLNFWTCTGGGTNTYAHNMDNSFSMVIHGTQAAYLGNYYCNPCSSTPDDTSCISDTACAVNTLPAGYPLNTAFYGGSTGLSLSQTVNGLTPGATYVLEFWAGGEGNSWPKPGLFGVDVGFGDTLLRNNQTRSNTTDVGTRYIVEFMAVATSHTIKFTNWGHICSDCTELILDDVRLYTLAELNPSVPQCLGINPVALFSAPNHICPGTCTDFTSLSLNCFSFIWSFPGATPSASTDQNPTNICYNTPGVYPVTLIGSNATTSDTLTLNNYLTVYPYPPPQGINQSGDTLFAVPGAITYQWYYNGNIIAGATDYFYVAQASGDYNVVATDVNACEVEAVIFNVFAGIPSIGSSAGITLFPNPAGNLLTIRTNSGGMPGDVIIFNPLGERLVVVPAMSTAEQTVDVSALLKGLYLLEVRAGEKVYRSKFTRE